MFLRIHQYINDCNAFCHTCTCISPHFFGDGIFVLGSHQEVFDDLSSSKVYLNSMFTTDILKLSLRPWAYGIIIYVFLVETRCSVILVVTVVAVTVAVPINWLMTVH